MVNFGTKRLDFRSCYGAPSHGGPPVKEDFG
jgi:hypothetical protein